MSHTTCHTIGGRSKSIPKTEESVTGATVLRYSNDTISDIDEDAYLRQRSSPTFYNKMNSAVKQESDQASLSMNMADI